MDSIASSVPIVVVPTWQIPPSMRMADTWLTQTNDAFPDKSCASTMPNSQVGNALKICTKCDGLGDGGEVSGAGVEALIVALGGTWSPHSCSHFQHLLEHWTPAAWTSTRHDQIGRSPAVSVHSGRLVTPLTLPLRVPACCSHGQDDRCTW